MADISVLIVDDSALMRNLIGRIIENTDGLTIADKAMNGRFALQKLERCKPDIIILDLEMPEMGGLEFLQERKRLGIDIPVIVLSSITISGAHVTMECLTAGASDFVTKPNGSSSLNIQDVAEELTEKIFAYGKKYQLKKYRGEHKEIPQGLQNQYSVNIDKYKQQRRAEHKIKSSVSAQPRQHIQPLREHGAINLIAIGISTGGPNALRHVFAHLSGDIQQPMLVVQHMPPGFTLEFANSLNKICPLEVKEASDGDILKQGRILIAPGGKHILLERKSLATVVRTTETAPENGHRPSVDVLFRSVAELYQNNSLAVIMTGMGKDGAQGICEIYRQGSITLGQDESSSIVYGMPRVAYEMGGITEQVSLENMAETINKYALNNVLCN